MGLESIGNFFVDIKDDISMLCSDKKEPKEIEERRIISLALRALGLVGIAFNASSFLMFTSSFVLAPIPLVGMVVASVGIVVSYDGIVIGCNSSKFINTKKLHYSDIAVMLASSSPPEFQGTIFCKHAYRMMEKLRG